MRQPVLLNADLTENRRISPVAMTLTLNRVPLSTASIQPTEDETIPARAWVELFTPKGSAGIFRAREPDNTYGDRIATVELEHAIAEVGNSIVAEKLEEEMPLNNAMARLFGHYKGSVWQMATIPFTDTVTVDVDYENVLESINRLIKQTPYMMVFDFSTTPWTFGLAQTDESVTAEGRLSRNVMTGSIKYDDSNMATRAYAAYDNGEGQEALVYEDDAAAIAQYGLIEKKLNEVYANETKARAAAVKYLQSYNRPKASISVSGEELVHITGESLDAFETGKRMRFVFDANKTPIDEIIDSVRYNDLVANENDVTVSMAEEDDYEYVLNELKESNRRNRSRINRINDEIHRDLWSSDGRLHSQLDLTASHLRSYFEDTAEGYWSEIEQTAEHWRSVYADAQNNLGIVEQTASYWRSVYADAQNNLGQIEQTASYWRSTYADAQNNLGVIEQTASYWRSSYESIGGLLGEIEQTASYWRNTYTDTANSLRAEVQQTASYWRTQLVNEGTNQRSSIVQTAASLTFTADQIYLDGDTKISDILGVNSSGFLTVDGDIYQSGTIYPGGVTINRGGDLKMWTGGATGDLGSQVSLTGMDVNDMIVKASVSGNTLTLWKHGADLSASSGNRIINFSKATSLSGSWSGRNYTVTAKQNNVSVGTKTGIVYDGLVPTGNVTKSGNTVYRDFIVYSDDGEGNADSIILQKNIGITAYPKIAYDSTSGKFISSVEVSSSASEYYIGSYVGEYNSANHSVPVNFTYSGSPIDNSGNYGTTCRTHTLYVTGSSPISLTKPIDGYTLTSTSTGWYYYRKNGTTGANTEATFTIASRLYLGSILLNNENYYWSRFDDLATGIFRSGYSEGYTAGTSATLNLQSKTVSAQSSARTILPDSGYTGLSSVTINAVNPKLTFENNGSWLAKATASIASSSSTTQYYFCTVFGSQFDANHKLPVYIKYQEDADFSEGNGTIIATTELNAIGEWRSGYLAGWNGYHDTAWKVPTDTSGGNYYDMFKVPAAKSSATDTLTYEDWERAYNSVIWRVAQTPYVQDSQPSGYTNLGTVGVTGNKYVYFQIKANGSTKGYYIYVRG